MFVIYIIGCNGWLIDYLLFYVPLKNISLIWRRLTIASERLQNLGLRAYEQGGIFIVPFLLWHGTSVFLVSSEGPPHLVASYDTHGDAEGYSNRSPHRGTRTRNSYHSSPKRSCSVKNDKKIHIFSKRDRTSPVEDTFQTNKNRWARDVAMVDRSGTIKHLEIYEATIIDKKAKSGSAPVTNEFTVKLYKKRPNILRKLWSLIIVIWN
jgi:hypothetical protein